MMIDSGSAGCEVQREQCGGRTGATGYEYEAWSSDALYAKRRQVEVRSGYWKRDVRLCGGASLFGRPRRNFSSLCHQHDHKR
jgi:hypothetical protein